MENANMIDKSHNKISVCTLGVIISDAAIFEIIFQLMYAD